eukprot:3276262-Prymnesium_polylepis.1
MAGMSGCVRSRLSCSAPFRSHKPMRGGPGSGEDHCGGDFRNRLGNDNMSASTLGPLKKTTPRLPPAHPLGNAGAPFTATTVTPPRLLAAALSRAAQHALTRAHDPTRADPFSAPTKHSVADGARRDPARAPRPVQRNVQRASRRPTRLQTAAARQGWG